MGDGQKCSLGCKEKELCIESPEPREAPVPRRLGRLFGGEAIIVNRHPSARVHCAAGPKANDLWCLSHRVLINKIRVIISSVSTSQNCSESQN